MRLLLVAVMAGCLGCNSSDDHRVAGNGSPGTVSRAPGTSSGSAPRDAAVDAPGEPLAALLCARNASVCVFGGITSTPGPAMGRTVVMPDGRTIRLTDNGFELSGASCNAGNTMCVTGAITP